MPTIVITGASQGIGRAVAEAFAKEAEVHIALVARNQENLEAVAHACRALGAEAVVCPCDVTREEEVAHVAQTILGGWGAPDVLVNNAGVFYPGSLAETSLASFSEQIAVNLTSAFIVTQAFLPLMLERGAGAIFFMGSVASIKAYPGGAAYCTAKHGLLGLARSVREETRAQGIRVTTLLPGATLTPSWDGAALPEERFMPATDIAKTILDIYHLSERTVVEEIILRPQEGDL